MSHLSRMYRDGFGLMTDLYQLTMAYGYWKTGLYRRNAVFHLFYRKNPFDGNYAIVCGLELVVDFLNNLRFSAEDVQYLGGLKGDDGKSLFNEGFLNYLQRMEFNCDIDAIPEGTVVFPHEPLLRISGPIIQAQLIETALLNLVNFSTLIATKSARIVQAAKDDSVLEFGFRRAQGLDGAITASRAAFIGGCHATSNVIAGRLYGIPVKGTHSHSWVMCFDDEITSFRRYAEAMPNNCIFLVDTYDTIEGVKNAVAVGREMRKSGKEFSGIRLDSGDLAGLSIEARRMLDEAGFENTAIIASNDLDEYLIRELKEKGARITVWGVGTRLATAHGQSALGGVYKLAAFQEENGGRWDYRLKLSEQAIKISNPGVLQVRRFFQKDGKPAGDQLYNIHDENIQDAVYNIETNEENQFHGMQFENLLQPVFRNGKLVYNLPAISDIRSRSIAQQELFRGAPRQGYALGLEPQLHKLKSSLIRARESGSGKSE
jgi:nicotinate phosphoribosyltransferase